MSDDLFGNRMKAYEQAEAGRRFMPLLPVCARLDGKCFSRYTANMKRPYDERMSELMGAVTAMLVEETGARIGYTQSDEISLLWYSDNFESQIFFNGKIQKMVSVLASICTAKFNQWFPTVFGYTADHPAFFDCRVWQVPNKTEAANVFLWREYDATKNSIAMAAQHYYSHKELQGKNSKEMQEMLFKKGINWNNYPDFFKRGTYCQRRKSLRKFTPDELAHLPEKHEARRNPEMVIERSDVVQLKMPPLLRVVNRVDVIFDGAEPAEATFA